MKKQLVGCLMFAAFGMAWVGCSPNATPPQKTAQPEDYKALFARAQAENKLMLLEFTGPAWCPPCVALEKEVFADSGFQKYIEAKFVRARVEFPDPISLPENGRELIEKYLGREIGLPTLVIAKPDGTMLGKLGYQPGGPAVIVAEIEKVLKK